MAAKLAIFPVEAFSARTLMTVQLDRAEATVQARRIRAEVHFNLAVSAHESRLAVAVEVVDHLHAVKCSGIRAGIRQALVDVTFASIPNEAWRAATLKSTNFIDTRSVVVTRSGLAVILVHLANQSDCSGRA